MKNLLKYVNENETIIIETENRSLKYKAGIIAITIESLNKVVNLSLNMNFLIAESIQSNINYMLKNISNNNI